MKENLLYTNNEPLRQRNFAVELTDRDAAAFLEMCYRNGTDPAEVLAGFINDLVCGSHTRGSDERMYAQQYFERCCYDLCAPETFLRYLLDSGYLPDIVDCMECRGTQCRTQMRKYKIYTRHTLNTRNSRKHWTQPCKACATI